MRYFMAEFFFKFLFLMQYFNVDLDDNLYFRLWNVIPRTHSKLTEFRAWSWTCWQNYVCAVTPVSCHFTEICGSSEIIHPFCNKFKKRKVVGFCRMPMFYKKHSPLCSRKKPFYHQLYTVNFQADKVEITNCSDHDRRKLTHLFTNTMYH